MAKSTLTISAQEQLKLKFPNISFDFDNFQYGVPKSHPFYDRLRYNPETRKKRTLREKKDPELVAINSALSSVLINALDKIPIEQRIIVELKNIEGRSHKEIADYLDISVTAAKVRLHRAHQKLRQILEEVER